jgi:hypothetical protein
MNWGGDAALLELNDSESIHAFGTIMNLLIRSLIKDILTTDTCGRLN